MNDDKKEIVYLGILFLFMITANVILRITPQEQLQSFASYVTPITIGVFLIHFYFSRKILVRKFSKYLVFGPVKPKNYKKNYIIKAVHSGIFFATELFGIFVLAMSVFIIGFNTAGEDFEKILIWESLASFGIFPFLGQMIPRLLHWDEKNHREIQMKSGFYYESYY